MAIVGIVIGAAVTVYYGRDSQEKTHWSNYNDWYNTCLSASVSIYATFPHLDR
jgi:hypothetical protein